MMAASSTIRAAEGEYRYTVDEDDRILTIGSECVEFAAENGAVRTTADGIEGTSLWDHVASEEVRQLYRNLFASVRASGHAATVPFRCDGPECRRHMELTVTPIDESGALSLRSVLCETESRERQALLDADAPRDEEAEFLVVCSWCKRVKTENGHWVEVEEAAREMRLFDRPALPPISHGACCDCVQLLLGEMED